MFVPTLSSTPGSLSLGAGRSSDDRPIRRGRGCWVCRTWPSSRADLGTATGKHQILSPWLLTPTRSPGLSFCPLFIFLLRLFILTVATDPQDAIISPVTVGRGIMVTQLVSLSPLLFPFSILPSAAQMVFLSCKSAVSSPGHLLRGAKTPSSRSASQI